MNAIVAKFIVNELGVGELYKEYSGRDMFGDTTTGIVCDSVSDLYEVVFGFIYSETNNMLNGDLDNPIRVYLDEIIDIKMLANGLKEGVRWDNMDHSVIVY